MPLLNSWLRRLNDLLPNFDLLLLALFAIAVNLPNFSSSYYPSHDTQFVFQGFYYFYNQLYYQHTLPQWMPFEPFGLPAQLTQLRQLTPMSYMAMCLGLIFGIKNVMVLFKLSVVLEQLVLLFGMYLLSRHLFTRRITAFILCMAALHGATSWGEQIYFDLRLFYMFPLTMYAFLLFFDRRKSEYLWLWVLLMSLWVMGNTVYLALVWVFIFLVLGVSLWSHQKDVLLCLRRQTPAGIALLVLSICVVFAYGIILSDVQNSIDLLSRTTSGKNPLNTFLVHGGASKSILEIVEGFLVVRNSNRFIGFIPFILFIWALFRVHERRFRAFTLTSIALLALSFQGLFSILFYYAVPGLAYYRHLAFFYGLLKILVLIGAGYGFEDFLKVSDKQRIKGICLMTAAGFFAADAFRITGSRLYELAIDDTTKDRFFSLWLAQSGAVTFLTPLFILLIGVVSLKIVEWVMKKIGKRLFEAKVSSAVRMALILGVLFLEAYNVHAYAYRNFPKVKEDVRGALYTVDVAPIHFQSARSLEPEPGRQQDAVRLSTSQRGSVYYSSILDFAQVDMCHTDFRVDGYAKGFSDLTETRNAVDIDLLKTLGCGVPKLRLVGKGIYSDSDQEAKEKLRQAGQLFPSVFLSGGRPDHNRQIPTSGSFGFDQADGTINVTQFTPDELRATVDVSSPQGAWLVYADAFNPNWQARIDGVPVPVYKAYLLFKSIRLEAGIHEIRFYYRNSIVFLSSYLLFFAGSFTGVLLIALLGRQVFNKSYIPVGKSLA